MKFTTIVKAAALAAGVLCTTAQAADQTYIATTAIVEHPALDSVRAGIKDSLMENGYTEDNLKFTFESAQGSPATAVQIARKMVGDEPDLIVAIATPSAQAAVTASENIPVIFSVVTDPLGAKLVSNIEKPGGNVTGLSDMLPLAQQLELLQEIMPNLKTLGVPYNPGEPNAVSSVEALKVIAKEKGIKIIEAPAPKSSDVAFASQKLIGKADAIYCPIDNTIISALEAVVKTGIDGQIPVFAADTDSVARGAIAALGFNYYDLGKQTGELVLRVLNGENAGDIPVKFAEGTNLAINPKMAARMGIEIPASVTARATQVIE
ncbi:ABC transporter substrate-binding protein [Aliamphritea ceti]|uniref:ABC transporter substrate-binding protein n=1 Tax=Aliamphritea ceti TaxID=1524258 RepID=UPI0021C3DDE5|nr:ABC transporter substrate-binding protein [Aliamphritea ceti]